MGSFRNRGAQTSLFRMGCMIHCPGTCRFKLIQLHLTSAWIYSFATRWQSGVLLDGTYGGLAKARLNTGRVWWINEGNCKVTEACESIQLHSQPKYNLRFRTQIAYWYVGLNACASFDISMEISANKIFLNILLAIRTNTIYKLMWWLYTVRYYTTYRYDVVRYSSSDVISGAL